MKMFNFNFSLFQRDNKQSNTIVINAEIKVSIEHIQNNFKEGNFKKAINFLDKLFIENEKISENKYHLLLLRTDFLRLFRKYNEFEENIIAIENNEEYKPYLDNSFKQLKLTLLAMKQDESFFKLSSELRKDTPNSKPQGHFDLVYYLNSGDLPKAKEIFDEEIKKEDFQKHLYLLGGHIYSSFYKYEDNTSQEYFNKADQYYQKEIENDNLDFLNKYEIQTFYATDFINNYLRQKSDFDLEYLKEYKKSLDNIYNNKEYFDNDFIKNLLESYMYTLLILNCEEEYFKLYEENKDRLCVRDYIRYCEMKKIDYTHKKIQDFIKTNFNLQDLCIYASFIKDRSIEEGKQVIEFLENNKEYIYKDSFILYCFVKGYILINKKLDDSLYEYLKEGKYQEIDFLLAFIEYQLYLDNEIYSKNIDKLLEFCSRCIYPRLIDSMEVLAELSRTEYLQLALDKEDELEGVIYKTLKICEDDQDLLFNSFHKFVDQIQNKDKLNFILGKIYTKYNKLNIAFNYFYMEYEKNKDINSMFEVLNTAHFIYSKSGEKFEYQKQKEVFSSILGEVYNFGIKSLLFLLGYEITLFQSASNILPILNQKLLEQDIKSLDKDIKISLSNVFIQTQFSIPNKNNIFLFDDNLCFENDGVTYIKESYKILEENTKNYSLKSIDENEYFLKNTDDSFIKSSIFHRIVGVFAFKCDNPTFTTLKMDETKEEPLEDFFTFMENQTNNTKNLFQRYSEGREIGLFSLSQSSYKNYFELIPFLLESSFFNFNAGKINYKDKSVNIILTLSSIVFLNHIGYLEKVLQRKDIFIQRTLVNWLKEYVMTIDVSNIPTKFDYLEDSKPKFYRNSEKEVKEFRLSIEKLIRLILENCNNRIVDDHLEILPIKGAYEMLSKHIGSQEFQCFSFAINNKFQIITEDTIYNMMFDVFKYKKSFISNSLALLEDILSSGELRDLSISLFSKDYKYVLSEQYILNLIKYMEEDDISKLQEKEYDLIKIANSYGWLDTIKKYYFDKFNGKYVKIDLQIKNTLDRNIEIIINLLNTH